MFQTIKWFSASLLILTIRVTFSLFSRKHCYLTVVLNRLMAIVYRKAVCVGILKKSQAKNLLELVNQETSCATWNIVARMVLKKRTPDSIRSK